MTPETHNAIEDVIDTLIEVGNGTTDEDLHEAADKLIAVRDTLKRDLPFPTVPLTVDIVITLGYDRIVLIERRDEPHGWALPGGFVEPGESAAQAAVREAFEETGLKVELIEQFHTYSKPGRDPRGPVASVCFIAQASGEPRGGDDAKKAIVYNICHEPPAMAFDHKQILTDYYNWRTYRFKPPVER